MTAETLDNGISRLLQFFFQLLNGCRQIFIILLAPLAAVDDVADDEQEHCPENDQRTQYFGDRNDDRSLP